MINVLFFSNKSEYLNKMVSFLEQNDSFVEVFTHPLSTITKEYIHKFDAVLIDLELKEINGYAVISKLRELNMVIPVLVVSVNDNLTEKLFAYKLGADDFLLKSNSMEEVFIKMKILIKKIDLNKFGLSDEILIHNLRINIRTLRVYRNDKEIELTKKEFVLLKTLAESRGKILHKSELMNDLWQGEEKTRENVVEVCVNSLRKKIDKNFIPKIIHTKIGFGYYLS